jgi:hypothetical protein
LQGFNGVFGRESAHHERQLAVGCHVHWCRIDALDILRGASAASVHFHHKFNVFHILVLSEDVPEKCEHSGPSMSPPSQRHTYRFETLATPHSRQRGLSRDVINPQDGHILCDRDPVISGFSLRIRRSSRIVNSTISTPKEIPVTFINRPFWTSSASTKPVRSNPPAEIAELIDFLRDRCERLADRSLAEKPKVGELQMDWLRSEDLKEEKNVTAPIGIIAGEVIL